MLSSFLLLAAWIAQLGQIQVPQPVGFVNDFARVLTPDMAARLERIVLDVRAKSGGEIVVVTLPDLRGRDPTDVARAIGRQWRVGARGGPGDRARNAGVIILVVPRETSSDGRGYSRIEVGTGAEGFLTDASVGAMQDEALPALRQRDYSGAIALMTWRVAERYAREFGFALDSSAGFVVQAPTPAPRRRSSEFPSFFWVVLFIIALSIVSRRRRRRGLLGTWLPIVVGTRVGRGRWSSGGLGRGGGWGGGGGGFSGFGGFGGGGGFSGGGAGRSF